MTKIIKGSGNVFADIGLPDPKGRALKAILARQIVAILKGRNLTQVEAGRELGLPQSKVSKLMNGKLAGFSSEKLISLLNLLGRDVEIKISDRKRPNPKIRVTTGNQKETAVAA